MPKTKISEFSATPANNTDIDSINIAEGCAPSGINDAIRELMAQLKDFQTGAVGDSFNGPVGTSTAAAGAFTTLAASGAVTLSGGTANGVAYLNGSKVVTSGSALTFDGTSLGMGNPTVYGTRSLNSYTGTTASAVGFSQQISGFGDIWVGSNNSGSAVLGMATGTFGQSTPNNIPWTVSAYGSEQMRLTSTGLGIGTSSPAAKLDVTGTFNGTQAVFGNTSGRGLLIGTALNGGVNEGSSVLNARGAGNGQFLFQTDGTLRMTLNDSGNLGLGVTPSAWASYKTLQIRGAALSSNTSELELSANAYFNSGWKYYLSSVGASNYEQFNGVHAWFNAPSGTAGNPITFTQAMTLDAGGLLTVGTTTNSELGVVVAGGAKSFSAGIPQYQFQAQDTTAMAAGVGGAINFVGKFTSGGGITSFASIEASKDNATSGEYGASLVFKTRVNGGAQIERARIDSDGTFRVKGAGTAGSSDALQISGSAPANAARIDSSGNFLVGTTSVLLAGKISAIGGASENGGAFQTTAAANNYTAIAGARNGNVGNVAEWWYAAGTQVGTIAVTASATAYNTSSDYRLKNTIAPMTGALAKVALLKPCTYKWNADGSNGEGFIAHELAEVCPNAVTGTKDAVDVDGNPKYQGIDTSFLVATLTAAIQELKAEFDAYKASHP
jgi:hypothetical protein